MIKIRRFKERHKFTIDGWFRSREMRPPSAKDLPETGWMAWDGDDYVAAIFCRVGEGLGMIEGLVSNPYKPGEVRHVAINTLVKTALDYLKIKGVKRVMAFSVDGSTLKRAESLGFTETNQRVIAIHL